MTETIEIKGQRYKSGPWIIWSGGENPVPGELVQVQVDNETRIQASSYLPDHSEGVRWKNTGISDVICYRVLEPVRPKIKRVTRWLLILDNHWPSTLLCSTEHPNATHTISFNIVDGVVDTSSIRMDPV